MTRESVGFELRGIVTTPDDRRFSAPAVNLTRASVFLETAERLSVHDRVRLSIQELELDAEVGLVSMNPTGLILSFRVAAENEERIDGLIARVRVLPSTVDEPWSEATIPGDEADIAMALNVADHGNTTDSLATKNPNALTGEFAALTPNPFMSTTPTPFADVAIGRSVPASVPAGPLAPPLSSVEATLPELAPDGTLRFASADAFQTQFKSNLIHGGIVARSTPLPIGSQKVLKFLVPGISDEVQLSARVGFVGAGTVGFMIDTFAVHRPRLESILERLS